MIQSFTYDHPKAGPITHNVVELHLFKVDGANAIVDFTDDKGRKLTIFTNAQYVLRAEEDAHLRPVLVPEEA